MICQSPTILRKSSAKAINWNKVDVFIRKETQIIKLVLISDFINWCWYGKIGLTKSEFIKHVYNEHNGKPPHKQSH